MAAQAATRVPAPGILSCVRILPAPDLRESSGPAGKSLRQESSLGSNNKL